MSQKDSIVIQLRVPRAWIERLNVLAAAKQIEESGAPITQLEWWKTSDGRAWLSELNSGRFNGLPSSEISNLTRKRYLDYIGPKKRGRPVISEARSKVLEEALDLYAQNALKLVA